MRKVIYILFIVCVLDQTQAQQIPDTIYKPHISQKFSGVVYVDHAHNNFHRIDNRFKPFANVLSNAGYTVKVFDKKFTKESLRNIKILIISNALSPNARSPFTTPTESAFSSSEIKAIENWVSKGGSLFLIADHMPFAGASKDLGKVFGFKF